MYGETKVKVSKKQLRKDKAEVRKADYEAMTLDQKIQEQIDGGYNGKQLKRLLKLKETQAAKK